MGKCPLKQKMSVPVEKGPSVSFVGRKVRTYCSNDQIRFGSSIMKMVRAREEEVHTLLTKWSSRTKRLAGSDRRVIENSRLRTIKTDPLRFLQ